MAIILFIIFAIICGIIAMLVYFLPSIIAAKKGHADRNIILLINVLLGWTFLGWLCCLVWALVYNDGIKTSNNARDSGGNKYEDLEQLQKLKDAGTITEQEFNREKQKLLN